MTLVANVSDHRSFGRHGSQLVPASYQAAAAGEKLDRAMTR